MVNAEIGFRVDASQDIGTGHVMRCLALADYLRRGGAVCRFICRDLPGNLSEVIRGLGYRVDLLPAASAAATGAAGAAGGGYAHWLGVTAAEDAVQTRRVLADAALDWLVVDHYALDAAWEREMGDGVGKRLLVIDDLVDREHHCDVLLDQNPGRVRADYDGLLPPTCRVLAGPRYALLRPEFAACRAQSLERRRQPRVRRLLVTLGGLDKDQRTLDVLRALSVCDLPAGCSIVVVMGPLASGLARVQDAAAGMPVPTEVRIGVRDMATVMAQSDVAIGAGGVTALERCCLGLPTLTLVIAENQRAGAEALAAQGAALLLEDGLAFEDGFKKAFKKFGDPAFLEKMQGVCALLVDGQGGGRVAEEMLGVQT